MVHTNNGVVVEDPAAIRWKNSGTRENGKTVWKPAGIMDNGKIVALTNISNLNCRRTNCTGTLTFLNGKFSGEIRLTVVGPVTDDPPNN